MIPSVRMHVTSRNFGGPSILMSFPLHISGTHPQWLKWSCEAGGLPWRSQVGENPIPIPHPTNLVLFGHKITLYRSNQGLILLHWGSNRSRGLSSLASLTLTTAHPRQFSQNRRPLCKGEIRSSARRPDLASAVESDYSCGHPLRLLAEGWPGWVDLGAWLLRYVITF